MFSQPEPGTNTIFLAGTPVVVLRLDKLHPQTGGNKWFKLKNNLQAALAAGSPGILTVGGPHSNHLHATAAACALAGLQCAAVVTGYTINSPTLTSVSEMGMRLFFAGAKAGSEAFTRAMTSAREACAGFTEVPSGGANKAGVEGSAEIMKYATAYDVVACACGSGTTFAGLAAASLPGQRVIGISALRGQNTLPETVRGLLVGSGFDATVVCGNEGEETRSHFITNAYAHSGFAARDGTLLKYKESFETGFRIPLDYIYLPRLFFAVEDLMRREVIPRGKKVLVVHSGGLQGNAGFEERYRLRRGPALSDGFEKG